MGNFILPYAECASGSQVHLGESATSRTHPSRCVVSWPTRGGLFCQCHSMEHSEGDADLSAVTVSCSCDKPPASLLILARSPKSLASSFLQLCPA